MYKDGFIDEFPNGARGESRTPMTLRSIDFESIASADSATRANFCQVLVYHILDFFQSKITLLLLNRF